MFAGMAVYSLEEYAKFEEWLFKESGQVRFIDNKIKLSITDKHRCPIMNDFSLLCKKNKLGISLKRSKGFKTYNPAVPINFYTNTPQTESDKAL